MHRNENIDQEGEHVPCSYKSINGAEIIAWNLSALNLVEVTSHRCSVQYFKISTKLELQTNNGYSYLFFILFEKTLDIQT